MHSPLSNVIATKQRKPRKNKMELLLIKIGKRELNAVRRDGKLYPVFIWVIKWPAIRGPYGTLRREADSLTIYKICDREITAPAEILFERTMSKDEISRCEVYNNVRKINLEHYQIGA
jgi:hypothetical protein